MSGTIAVNSAVKRQRGWRTLNLAAGILVAGVAIVGQGADASAVSHTECRLHGFRPYAHRHVDPGDKTITCERPAITGRPATTARCVAEGFSGGTVVLGTRVSSEIPIPPQAPAAYQADALNQACSEAIAGCWAAAQGLGKQVSCKRVDQNFSQ